MNIRPKTYSVDEALNTLRGFCNFQERCHKDVREKLRKMNMISEASDYIINQLIQENYLNEERFAKTFARGKFRIKYWGKVRIIRELKYREISKYNIETALKEIDEQEYHETLDRLAKKRFNQIKETHPSKKRKKLADYLLYRGWESNLVYDKVAQLIQYK